MIPARVSVQFVLTSIFLVFVAGGCAKAPGAKSGTLLDQLLGKGSNGTPLSLDDPLARETLEKHLERAERRIALQGSARVLLEGPDFKLNRPQRIAVSRPEQLRFEVLGLFDLLAALLVSNGEEFAFFDASTGEMTRGEMTQDLLWELAQLDLDPGEVVDLLLAAPRPSDGLEVVGLWRRGDAGITVAFATPTARCPGPREARCGGSGIDLDRVFDDGLELFGFDESGRLLKVESIGIDRRTRFRAEFDGFSNEVEGAEGFAYPMAITLHSPQVGAKARFEWKRVALAESLAERVFALPEDP